MTANDETKRILKARAQALAREPVKQAAAAMVELVEFKLANERYGLETAHLREVQPLKELTPVPCTPAFVRGVINVRGKILAVIDLKTFFDLPDQGLHDLHKVLIVQSADMELGILADDVVGVQRVPVSQLQASLPSLTGIRERYLHGVTGAGLVVLDVGKLLADQTLIVNAEVT